MCLVGGWWGFSQCHAPGWCNPIHYGGMVEIWVGTGATSLDAEVFERSAQPQALFLLLGGGGLPGASGAASVQG